MKKEKQQQGAAPASEFNTIIISNNLVALHSRSFIVHAYNLSFERFPHRAFFAPFIRCDTAC